MMREYSITTWAGSCTPKNTAEPSIAGVKNGRPAITSTTRNQSATAPAPMSPAMNPSRRIRVSCMTQYRFHPGLAPGVSIGRMPLSRRLVYPLCLLAGSLLAVAAGALHPDLAGPEGPSQLPGVPPSRARAARHSGVPFRLPPSLPRGLGAGAVVAGSVGIVLALVFREDAKADQAAFVLPVVWQLVTAVMMLRGG